MRLPVPVNKQLVSHCVHLFIHDHTQEPFIGFICLVLCNFLMHEGCGYRSYGYLVRKKHDHTPKKPSCKPWSSSTFVIFVLSGGCGFNVHWLCLTLSWPPIPVYRQLVSYYVHLHTQDHTQEPSIGFIYMIVPHFSCRMGVVVVCKWLYTFVWKKHDHSQGKSLIDCIYHLVLMGRVWLYITCICMV